MKRPDKIVLHEVVMSKEDHIWVDHNGKPKRQYYIEIPFWLGRAYNLDRKRVQILIGHTLTMKQREADMKVVWDYFKANWSKKVEKMRRMNSGYMLVSKVKESSHSFASIEDYNAYHKELAELNKKYKRPMKHPDTAASSKETGAKPSGTADGVGGRGDEVKT